MTVVKKEYRILSSDGKSKLYIVRWEPKGTVFAVLHISHGMLEHIGRYEAVSYTHLEILEEWENPACISRTALFFKRKNMEEILPGFPKPEGIKGAIKAINKGNHR